MRASDYIDTLTATGRFHFTLLEAVRALGGSLVAVRAALLRLQKKGHLALPHRGFYVVVPPEFRRLGCLPAEQFIPQLMGYLGEPYYVALLSAAELHGAAHQRPQAFQVMLSANRPAIECGAVRVQFIARKHAARTAVIEKNTPRGPLRIASPEATALELVGYADQCGGLDHVAAVLAELAEGLEPAKLLAAAQASPVVWAQRLGYLLDRTGHGTLAEVLLPLVREHAHSARLARASPATGSTRSQRWKLSANVHVEADA
ncbi:MAG: type IV toxin-antitoxin system AbiEi family antitoxin [Myxococcaceae bacterium]|nr:type IV toxin-antitoxin system AbiEi family antitoxin [Myxococcaceae bacterium]